MVELTFPARSPPFSCDRPLWTVPDSPLPAGGEPADPPLTVHHPQTSAHLVTHLFGLCSASCRVSFVVKLARSRPAVRPSRVSSRFTQETLIRADP